MKKHLQQSFAGGELSPAMYGRLDDQKYQQGLATCRNFVVLPQGPVRNRAGFAYVGAAKYADKKTRLIPFTFSSADTMVLELGHKYIRVLSKGGYVPAAAGSTAPLEIATPYDEADIMDLHFAQSADVVTIVHPGYRPKELRRKGAYSWSLTDIVMTAPVTPPTGLAGTYYCGDDQAKDAEKKAYTIKYKVTAISVTDEGNRESEASAVCSVTGNLYLNASKITLTWNRVSGADRYRVYKTYSGIYGYVAEVEDPTFVDNNTAPDTSITPPRYDDPFSTAKGITAINVTNGGSGYNNHTGNLEVKTYTVSVRVNRTSYSGSGKNGDAYTALTKTVQTPTVTLSDSTGSGGAVTISHTVAGEYVNANGAPVVGTSSIAAKTKPAEYVTVTATVTVTSAGTGYSNPKAIIRWANSASNTAKRTVTWTDWWNGDRESFSGTASTTGTYETTVTELPLNQLVGKPYVTITDSAGSGATAEAVVTGDKVTAINIIAPGMGYTDNPTVTITSATGSGAAATAVVGVAGDYPGAVSYFEQRRIFAGSKNRPQFVWMTRPGTESDMHYSLPSQKDDRIKFRIAALQASRIRHVVPLSSLILMTTGAEFRVTTANDDMLTPNSVGVKPQSYVGASNVQPQLVNSSIVYAAERGGHVWELGYNWQASGFVTGDMCLRSAHLFDTCDITDMALSKAPYPIIWCTSTSGGLLGCTYVPEQGIGAWHRHDTKGGVFESIACVAEGDEDILYAVVKRVINGRVVRYIERMHEREGLTLEGSFFVDCGVEDRYDTPRSYVDGLQHLEGETVSILADGKVMPQAEVTNGRVDFPEQASHVVVGIPIEADLKTLPMALQDQKGGYAQGSNKNIIRQYVRVYQSSGLKLGPDFGRLSAVSPRQFEPYGTPPSLKSALVDVMLQPSWTESGSTCLRQDEPLPLMVCGLVAEIAT